MCFAPIQEGSSINESQKKDTEKKAKTFCFRKTGFAHYQSELSTPYSLFP